MKKYHLRYLMIPLLISIITITGLITSGNLISEKKFEVKNLNQTKNSVALTKVIEHDTVKTYNQKTSYRRNCYKTRRGKTDLLMSMKMTMFKSSKVQKMQKSKLELVTKPIM